MIDLAVRRLREDAVLPRQAYVGDAGLDLSGKAQRATLRRRVSAGRAPDGGWTVYATLKGSHS